MATFATEQADVVAEQAILAKKEAALQAADDAQAALKSAYKSSIQRSDRRGQRRTVRPVIPCPATAAFLDWLMGRQALKKAADPIAATAQPLQPQNQHRADRPSRGKIAANPEQPTEAGGQG